MRIILYTGKGGVGKTSIAALTACKIASKGKKVLVLSTDQAHSLSDSFDVKLNYEPLMIKENLYAMEIDTIIENEKMWGSLKSYIEKLMVLKSKETIESEELLVFPGFEELLSLIKIKQIYEENQYDVLIVDCAPTGETISLLKFPDVFKWWMDKIFPIKKKGAKIAGPVIEKTLKIPMPEDDTFDDIERLYVQMDELHKLMLDKEHVSIRIVTTPEKIVVKEAKRSFSYLHLFDYNVDTVIVNKIFPQSSMKGYFTAWEELQKESLEDIKTSFGRLPIFYLELMKYELRGYDRLLQAANVLFEQVNPEEIFFQEKIFNLDKEGNGYIFRINMPFVDKSELGLSQNGDEVTISIKNEKRSFVLPTKLKNKQINNAKYEEGNLKLYFD